LTHQWNLPAGYAPRPARRDDLQTIARLAREVDVADYGESSFEMDFIARDWDRPDFDPSSDAWVVLADGAMVGYGAAFVEAPGTVEALGLVHPDHRGRGIGAALAEAAERHAAELRDQSGEPAVRLQTPVAAPDAAGRELLSAGGYHLVRSFFHMEVELSEPISADPGPEGITIRDFVSGRDERAAHATIEAAFAGTWGFHPLTYEEFGERILGHDFDPRLSLVADQDDGAVGVLLGDVMSGLGWVDMLAVLPGWRGRGIGAALLRAAFVRFRERGLLRAMLNVDSENEAGAVGVYQQVGMRVRRRWDLYEKEIPRPA
jgi:mycothiol synthase